MRHKKYKSLRLKDYDYSQPGAYFITICTYKRFNFFGDVKDDAMILSAEGLIANSEIKKISSHYENVEIGEYIVMPNHVHLVIYIYDLMNFNRTEEKEIKKTGVRKAVKPVKNPRLQDIVGSYKSAVTRETGKTDKTSSFKWQRYFNDHVIRNDKALENISDYIRYNPAKWNEDIENSKFLSGLSETSRENKAKIFYKNLSK